MKKENPLIIVFACQWCAYQGADQAGSLKLTYPSNVYIIKVPCTGRIEPEFIIEALSKGADGVFIGGCHSGECHYKDGNIKAKMRIALLKQVLKETGFEPERIQIEWISAGEGRKFAQTMRDFSEKLKNIKR